MFAYNVRNSNKLAESMINVFETKDNSNYNLRNKCTDLVLTRRKTRKIAISYWLFLYHLYAIKNMAKLNIVILNSLLHEMSYMLCCSKLIVL